MHVNFISIWEQGKNQQKSYISGNKNLTTPKAGESMEQWELKPFIELTGVSTIALGNNLAASNKIKDTYLWPAIPFLGL